MRRIIIGFVWIIGMISVYILILCDNINDGNLKITNNGDVLSIIDIIKTNPSIVQITIFFILMIIPGIFAIIEGIYLPIINNKINKYGIPTYGIIKSSFYMSEPPESLATIEVINPETNEIVKTKAYYEHKKYKDIPNNTYILCKYYKKHIVIDSIVSSDEISDSYKEILKPNNK